MTATVSPVFNRILTASQIEEQAKTTLKKWFPTYLREIERQLDVAPFTYVPPENYSDRNSFDMEAAEQLPKIVVIAPGIIGSPRKRGDGTYESTWRLGIGIATGAPTEEQSNMLVKGYGAAARAIMLQNSGLADFGCVDVRWTDESYDDVPLPNFNQLVKAASLYFDLDMTDVVTRGGGPETADEPEYDYSTVETVEIDIEKLPINQ